MVRRACGRVAVPDDMNTARANSVATVPGQGGLPKVVAIAADGTRLEAYLHGAQVTSWRPAAGDERLYLSPQSSFSPGQPIRGGIPLCFPQFADQGPLPMHGFVRESEWAPVFAGRTAAEAAEVRLRLADSPRTREAWPHAFACDLVATASGNELTVTLEVTNAGGAPFAFTGALHTYLRVRDVRRTVIEGLTAARYRDKRLRIDEATETAPALALTDPLDRVYHAVPAALRVREAQRIMVVRATGSTDTVIWNPGPPSGPGPHDLPADGYLHMLCVEAAIARTPHTLDPGATHALTQRLTALSSPQGGDEARRP